MRIARIALDVPLPTLFDYACPEGTVVNAGDRVVVPFGKRRLVGVVLECVDASELAIERIKPLESVLEGAPALPSDWLALTRFLSSYYQRPLGETVMGALPPRLRSLKPLPRARKSTGPAADQAQETGASSTLFEPGHPLTLAQQTIVDRVLPAIREKSGFSAFLLHGVTGSGKTEVYFHLVAEVLRQGGQALVLVPEIGLTPQLESRFRVAFPSSAICMLHSGLEDGPRTAGWLLAARGEAGIVLGTRLAVLAPLPRLALVIVDEEHDSSFKQQEGLRYSGRDAAVFRASQARVPVVLGSATPSLESYANALAARYTLLELPQRASPGAQLPQVRTVDMRESGGRDDTRDGLSAVLAQAIEARLARGEQSLVFINRRGYAPVLACTACGWAAGCTRCSARMVMHRADRRLRCHHCGQESALPRACPDCGNVDLQALGRGTQRVEEALAARFPAARLVRIDRDTARRKSLAETLQSVRDGGADILVGTQLVAKGHDFPGLTLVGVLNADSALVSTDYRAAERLFGTLMQVAGRAGRRETRGEVLIQTRFPGHPLYASLARHDYAGFARTQLAEREAAGFPPYVFEAVLRAEAPHLDDALAFLREATQLVEPPDGVRIYDPVANVIVRRANLDRAQLVVQSVSRLSLQGFLRAWNPALFEHAGAGARKVRWHLDVDPIEFD